MYFQKHRVCLIYVSVLGMILEIATDSTIQGNYSSLLLWWVYPFQEILASPRCLFRCFISKLREGGRARWSLSNEFSRLSYYKSSVFILRILSVQTAVSQSPHFPPSGAKINSLIAPRLTCAFLSQRALGALGGWPHIPTSHPHQTTQCAHPSQPTPPTWNPMRSQATWWAVL